MTSATSPPREQAEPHALAPPTLPRDEVAFATFWGFVAAAAYAPFAVMPLTRDVALGQGRLERRFGVIVSARGALPFRPLCYCTLLAASFRLPGDVGADQEAPAETTEADQQQWGLRL